MSELRKEPRTACYVPASLLWHSEYERVVRCSVADITPGGARILVLDSSIFPDRVRLSTPFFRTPRPAKICWRKPREIGVRFPDEGESLNNASINTLLETRAKTSLSNSSLASDSKIVMD